MGMSSPTAGELFAHLIELTRLGSLRARSRTFARGEVVFHEGDMGDTIHLIERGLFAVRTSTTAGRSLIINVLATGDVFGEFAVFTAEGRRTSSVTSLAGGATIAIERDDLRALLHDSPDLVDALLSAVVTKAENTRVRLVELLAVPADLRVLRALLFVAALDDSEGPVPLTQLDLASLAATTRPTANKVLRGEEERGALRLSRGGVTILDPVRLAHRARVDRPLR